MYICTGKLQCVVVKNNLKIKLKTNKIASENKSFKKQNKITSMIFLNQTCYLSIHM